MITGGFGVSVLLGDDGQQRTRQWYIRTDGVKRWADNDQPCEPQQQDPMNSLSNNSYFPSKPVCAVDGLLYDGQALCGKATVGGNPKRCNSDQPCRHNDGWVLHQWWDK